MRKLLVVPLVFLFALMMTSCGVAYLMGTTPEEITTIDGHVECVVDCGEYEVMVGKEITKKQAPTQSRLWLYTYEEDYYWVIKRSEYETSKSFFEKDILMKVENLTSKEFKGGKLYSYFGTDVATGESFYVKEMPWSEGYGRFFLVGNGERRIVYSVGISDIRWK